MRHTTIRAILTDLDGVLRHFPKERDAAIEYEFHLPPGILSKTAFQTGLLYSAVTGQITNSGEIRLWILSLRKLTDHTMHKG
jgi:glucose-1-phosphatase